MDEQESNQGEYHNHDLESTLARMANYFERQERQNGKVEMEEMEGGSHQPKYLMISL